MISSQPSGFASEFSKPSEDSVLYGFIDENICGEGASCRVYRMRLNGLRVAVKRLRKEYLTNPAYVASYRKEFQLGQQLKHDGLPVYRELRTETDEVYIVMDFVDGVKLDDFIATEAGQEYFSSTENVKRFLTQLLDVVGYLYRSGVIHCDIKPANIMLRHSDRGVMLLDLDKSYCDSLDLTHGGTAEMSDPLNAGEKPTAAKDFSAIGNLIAYLADTVPGFPQKRLQRFRKECLSETVTYESLVKTLNGKSHIKLWIVAAIVSVIAILIAYILSKPTESSVEPTAKENDTVRIIERVIEQQPVAKPLEAPAKPKVGAADYDVRLSGFISEAQEALAVLSAGKVPDKEIRDMMSSIIESHSSRYQELLKAYKSENPEMSGVDVELTVARASEKSKATRLLQQITQAAADTIAQRHPNPEL